MLTPLVLVPADKLVLLFTQMVVDCVAVRVGMALNVPVEPALPAVAPFGGKLVAIWLVLPVTIPLFPPVIVLRGRVPE
jgi:hypothetical protein